METKINPIDGAEMVLVPAGPFKMGLSQEEIKDYCSRSRTHPDNLQIMRPQRTVFLDAYWIYKHPVTFGQYRAFCAVNRKMDVPRNTTWISMDRGDVEMGDDFPVVNLTWTSASHYCKWAKVQLPTEAQWEKAARGPDGFYYPWGNEWNDEYANFRNDSHEGPESVFSRPEGVSPYGAMQMSGNVKEWCEDRFAPYGFDSAPFKNQIEYWEFVQKNGLEDNAGPPLVNPMGPAAGMGRVIRGGGWGNANGKWAGLTTFRGSERQTENQRDLGFRPVLLATS